MNLGGEGPQAGSGDPAAFQSGAAKNGDGLGGSEEGGQPRRVQPRFLLVLLLVWSEGGVNVILLNTKALPTGNSAEARNPCGQWPRTPTWRADLLRSPKEDPPGPHVPPAGRGQRCNFSLTDAPGPGRGGRRCSGLGADSPAPSLSVESLSLTERGHPPLSGCLVPRAHSG